MNQLKSLVQDIHKGKNLERNLNKYQEIAVSTYYDYAALELTFSAYTLVQEALEEKPELAAKEKRVLEQINQALSDLGSKTDDKNAMIDVMKELREEITDKMDLFTAYTDRLICYEYVLNRMELKYLPSKELNERLAEMNEEDFLNRLMLYTFHSKDQSVIRDKIRLIAGQIPVHMTKSKLFEKVSETFTLYKDGSKSDLDDFIYMLRTSAMLYEPKKYVGEYPSFEEALQKLETADYVQMKEETYNEITDILENAAREVHEITDFYYSIQKVVNGIYAMCLIEPYQEDETKIASTCKNIWKNLAKNDYKDEMLIPLEGKIEAYVSRTSYLESVLFEIKESYQEKLDELEMSKCFTDFGLIANLLSDSLFVDLEKAEKNEVADAAYVQQKTGEVLDELSKKLSEVTRPVKKAIMGQILEKVPMLFANTDEVSEYVRVNLLGCQDKAEKCIVMSILADLIQEEEAWQ